MQKAYFHVVAGILLFALFLTKTMGQYPGSGQLPLNPTTIPQFVDPLPHFAGLRVDAKAGGKLIIEAVMTQQVALSKGTVLDNGVVGTTAGAGSGNYFVYRISKDGGKKWTLPLWPSFTIEAQRGKKLDLEVRNKLNGRSYADVNITADQTVMMSGVPLTGNPMVDPYTGPVPIAVHLHGGEVPSASDGGPYAWFTPDYALKGKGWSMGVDNTLHYPNTQEAATLWYHEHSQLGLTRMNVYAGMAGFYFLRGPDEERGLLPGWSKDDMVQEVTPAGKSNDPLHPWAYLPEIEIAIQDRMFDTKGQLYYPVDPTNPGIHPFWSPEFFGDVITVNGKSWPYLSVAPRKYRFHLLNGSNARFYNVWLKNLATSAVGPAITQIGTDGGLLDAPATIPAGQALLLGCGERADVIIDFSNFAPGTVLTLMNDANTPYPNGDPVDIGTTDRIMQFVVNGKMIDGKDHDRRGTDMSMVPAKLRSNPLVKLTDFAGRAIVKPVLARQLTLNEVMGDGGPVMVLLNNSHFEEMPEMPEMFGAVTEKPVEGTTEKWQLINLTMDAHPMHMHLVQFQLVSRQDFNADLEGVVPGGYLYDYMAALESKNKMGGGGPPNDYDAPNSDGAVGGNLPISGYLRGEVIPAKANEKGWKDVIVAYPGQIMTYMVRFAPTDLPVSTPRPFSRFGFDPSKGPGYVWHCHIIEHEDNDMMRPMNVQPNPFRPSGPDPVIADYKISSISDQNIAGNNTTSEGFALEQNFPNPFSTETEIKFRIPEDSHVQLKLFNYMGAEVKTLIDSNAPAGNQTVKLYNDNLPGGIYYYQIKTGNFSSTKKLIIIR